MICNAEEPMCIAGVFGGQDSGISEITTNVFLESAYFDPVSIRKTARRHQLSTDASFRYERGCDPNNTLYVLKRCALLIQEVAGGEIAMEITDQGTTHFAPFPVELNISRVNALIGKELGEELIETILHAMEVEIYSKENGIWQIGVPRYRVDVQRECDVVEDILRIYGYNNVEFPEKLNTSLSYNPKPNPVALQIRISEQLTAQGFNEILNNSLTKVSYYEPLEGLNLATCVKIMNPLSQDLGVMRQTLLFGGLESIQRNANRKNADLKFYEFGNCYHYNAQKIADRQAKDPHWVYDPLYAYSEEPHLALWLTGNKTTQSWVQKEEKTSFYTLHAYVNNVLRRLGVNIANCTLEPLENELCSDGMVIKAPNGKQIGMMGVVSGKLLKAFDIDNPVYYADLDWNMLLRLNKQYKPVINDLPKFPEVKRDFALLVDKAVKFADLAKAALATEKKLLKQVTLFDVYEGKNLEAGKKSYALSFILQDTENTLKDKQIEAIMAKLLKTFEEKFGAKLR
jgi:phenylalanyl-tRNA synthetase beta chain